MREYTMDDFKVSRENCKFHDSGYWRYAWQSWYNKDGFEVNYSSILTNLIQNAGRWCEHHASDLFIIWNAFEKRLEDINYTGEKLVLGFRESGVDKNENVIKNYNENCHYYRKIITVEIEVRNGRIDMYM